MENFTLQAHDSDRWIKDLLISYEQKLLTKEELIERIRDANFEAYKMGYEQHSEDIANDNLVVEGQAPQAEFDETKEEWLKKHPDPIKDWNYQNHLSVETKPGKGTGIQGPFYIE